MLPGIFTLGLDGIDYRFIGSELIDKFLRNIADAENYKMVA